MSIQHIAMVLEAEGLCAQEKAVLTAICNHTDTNGKTFAGEDRLMREAGMPRTTFQRWRAKLADRELILSRRRGRQGGGQTTADTYINLAALRSMRDPFFGNAGNDRPEDENPFEGKPLVDINGPASGAKGATRPSNGPASGAFNGPASGADPAPPVGPITLINPQGEHTHSSSVADDDAQKPETTQSVCVDTQKAIRIIETAIPNPAVRDRMTPDQKRELLTLVSDALNAGARESTVIDTIRPMVNDSTTHPVSRVREPLRGLKRRLESAPQTVQPEPKRERRECPDCGAIITSAMSSCVGCRATSLATADDDVLGQVNVDDCRDRYRDAMTAGRKRQAEAYRNLLVSAGVAVDG